ncbi:hypothetical protein [Flavobacterium sp. HTF]|uniref:hypothetical protein n=1 Tax=Flavobacterium sp. HTF TaxID=2170732 RepID=UPI000D5D01AF|nr:hypothetical protein [Flavobacterium sp. HTF]PWB19374.1 hypothetical protein DCO46_21765 [Flavobacterium sp. HTF]
MDKETFKKRFETHSGDDLILMATKNAEKYNPEAVLAAKEILSDRNIDIEAIIENEKANELAAQEEFSDFNDEKSYIESLSPLDQMKYLSERRADFEENIEEIVELNNENLTDEEILLNFENILDAIKQNEGFGDLTEMHSKENYFLTSNIIEEKMIQIPFLFNDRIEFANQLARKDFRKKFNRSILFGLVLLTLGLVFAIGTGGGNLAMYIIIVTGITFCFRGFRGRIRLNNGSQNLLQAY